MKSLFNRFGSALVAVALGAGHTGYGVAQQPGMAASPLAGGQAATAGGAYMDVHGNPIIMPASYGQPCDPYGGYGGGYGDDGSGWGVNGCPDYGGYSSPDQSGPHYFDIAVGAVALRGEDLFQDVPALGSIGLLGDPILDPDQTFDDYDFGWEIAARYDLGPLSVLEATYMGLYDIGFTDTVRSVDVAAGVDFQLNTVFSGYGLAPIDGLDEGSVYQLDYQSDLQSTEFSYRRYWVGYNPRISGTYLAGFRYIRMTEDLNFNATALAGDSNILWSDDNDLVGAQLGGDAWVTLRQGLRLGAESKAGIYNNRYKYRHTSNVPDPDIADVDFSAAGNQVAFAGEGRVDLVADILPSFSIRGGYRVLYLNSLVTAGNNIDPTDLASANLFTQADALYHGFHATVEYIW